MGKLQLINIVIFWLFLGLVGAHFAKKRGRFPLAWFGICLMMGIFGLAMLFLLPKIEKRPAPQPVKGTLPPPKQSDAWLKMWYYLDPKHAQQGPFEFPDLIKTWKENRIGSATYIWGEGMKEWKRLRDQPDLIKEFDQA
ncbi:GYF domain-containing protein [Chlamydiota bacterium]